MDEMFSVFATAPSLRIMGEEEVIDIRFPAVAAFHGHSALRVTTDITSRVGGDGRATCASAARRPWKVIASIAGPAPSLGRSIIREFLGCRFCPALPLAVAGKTIDTLSGLDKTR
jgi:hypothetical protein